MNREKRRMVMKSKGYKKITNNMRTINESTLNVLKAGAEYFNISLDRMKIRYVLCQDKGKFIEDIQWMIEKIMSGEYEFNHKKEFVKVEE